MYTLLVIVHQYVCIMHLSIMRSWRTYYLICQADLFETSWIQDNISTYIDEIVLLTGLALQCRHNEHDSVSNHRRLDCLFNRLFRRRSKKTAKLCVTGVCEGNLPVSAQVDSDSELFPFDNVITAWVNVKSHDNSHRKIAIYLVASLSLGWMRQT